MVMGDEQPNTTLIRERFDRGLTVEQAAKRMKVGIDVLRRAETGRHIPRPGSAKRIADFYDLKPSQIWPIGGEDFPPDPTKEAA